MVSHRFCPLHESRFTRTRETNRDFQRSLPRIPELTTPLHLGKSRQVVKSQAFCKPTPKPQRTIPMITADDSTLSRPRSPPGAGCAFCNQLSKSKMRRKG